MRLLWRAATLLLVTAVALVGSGLAAGLSRDSATTPRATATAAPVARHAARPAKPRIVHGPHDRPVPILMYHVIDEQAPGAPYPDLYTPEHVFAAQMDALAKRGYHGVTLRDVELYWRRGYALPRKPIVVSFDDGYHSHYTKAGPVLRRLGWPGVLNLEVNNARTKGDITVAQVRELIEDGWEVGSHTVTHPDLTTLTADRLRFELVRSRAWLERRLGVPVDYFCYPSGRFNSTVEAAVKAAGYRLATVTQGGLAAPASPYELARIRVDGADGVRGLLRNLALARSAVTPE